MAKRRTRPVPRWHERITQAETPMDELSAACDGLRASLTRLARGRRDKALQAMCRAEADAIAREVSRLLADRAQAIRDHDDRRRSDAA
jgi:hypothetical protein